MPDPTPKLPVSERLAIAVIALTAAGCALLEMKGPGPGLTVTGDGMIPWAACSVLLLGIGQALWQWRPDGQRQRILAGGAAGLVILGTAILGLKAAPVTAGSLLVLSVSMLLVVLPASRRMVLSVTGLFLSALPGLMHVISLQGRALGIPLLPDDGATDLSWLMSAAMILLSLALVLTFRARH